tara:strand:+ start:302 stop:439 length:138 start_codon:yes stop_codon:yes gene_type:complete
MRWVNLRKKSVPLNPLEIFQLLEEPLLKAPRLRKVEGNSQEGVRD